MNRLARVLLFAALALTGCQRPEVICQQRVQEADTLTRAADICASESIGCNLTNEDITKVLRAQKAAQACLQAVQ